MRARMEEEEVYADLKRRVVLYANITTCMVVYYHISAQQDS